MKDPVSKLGEPTITKLLQERELDMLLKFREICRKNDIEFFLSCGTALGCARHSGYIPWDDDIDLYIRGRDYEKLREVFQTQDTGTLRFHDYSTVEGYPYPFPKIVDSSTLLVEESLAHLDYTCGVYIDIFPIFGITDQPFLRFLQEKLRYYRYALYRAYYFDFKHGPRKLLKKLVTLFCKPERLLGRLTRSYMRDRTDTAYLVDPGVYGKRALLDSADFSGRKEMMFENVLMPMPSGYSDYLTDYYGDYMQLPPESQRIARHRFAVLEIPGVPELEE